LITIGNEPERKDVFAIRIPDVLSLLAYNRLDGEVKGINNLQKEYEQTYGPGNYAPPIAVTYWSFRFMVGAGFLMLAIAVYSLYHSMRNSNLSKVHFLSLFPFAIGLPYIANTAGWMMTELGRQPWIVFGLLKTEKAFSPTPSAGMVLTSLIVLTLLYGVLMIADLYLLVKFAKAGPVNELKPNPIEEAYAG
jgi:cytochrome bd ubiquinol oxidase subunit I